MKTSLPRYTERMARGHKDEEKAQERGFYRFSFRIPLDLYDKVAAISKRQGRSIHAQLLWFVRRGVDEEERRQ